MLSFISKYYFILFLALLGMHALKGQDRILAQKQHRCKLLPAGKAIWVCFEHVEQLMERHEALFEQLSALKGQLECHLRLSLKKEKVKMVRLFWESDEQPRLNLFKRFLLRKLFQKIKFEVDTNSKISGVYKVTWVCAIKNGEVRIL